MKEVCMSAFTFRISFCPHFPGSIFFFYSCLTGISRMGEGKKKRKASLKGQFGGISLLIRFLAFK